MPVIFQPRRLRACRPPSVETSARKHPIRPRVTVLAVGSSPVRESMGEIGRGIFARHYNPGLGERGAGLPYFSNYRRVDGDTARRTNPGDGKLKVGDGKASRSLFRSTG